MKIKAGVSILGLKPEMLLALMVADKIISKYLLGDFETVITSCVEGKHSKKTSKHYCGYGVDLRSRNVAESERSACATEIGDALGPEFYVAFEKDHFHISFNGSVKS